MRESRVTLTSRLSTMLNGDIVEPYLNMLAPEVPQENGFDDLILPEGQKDLVQALVETHARGTNQLRESQKEIMRWISFVAKVSRTFLVFSFLL